MREKLLAFSRSGWFRLGIVSLLVACITFLQFQLSVSRIPFVNARMTLLVLLWNVLTFGLFVFLLTVLFKKPHIAVLAWGIFAFGLSFANYYVLLFHGAPVTVPLLKNTATAFEVLGSYRFRLDKYSSMILLCFLLVVAVVVLLGRITKGKPVVYSWKKRLSVAGACLLLLSANIYLGVFSSISFKPTNSIQFSWASSAGEYGFLPLQLESHFQGNMSSLAYDSYSEEALVDLYNDILASNPQQPTTTEYPDIVLILNESFYDLNQVVDLDTNIDPLANYYGIENAIKGYVVASGEGGGTNRSEYELLTGISTSLMPNQTPFLTLDLEGHASVVSFLEQFGYETYAAHCAKSANYNRNYGYPALGFDHSYFDLDFSNLESYGNRDNTDASAYKDLIKWYEEPSDKPKFMYMLTYQNHGGWEQNPAELDTVKVNNDFGEDTDQTNEYLSSLRLSDQAIVDLLDYFETVDRPVIVCMLGDHGPSFAKNIANSDVPEEELTYLLKSTPMLIWSNDGLESENLGYISLNYVVPKLLETAGLPLSPFYWYQTQLMEKVPIILSYQTFYDKDLQLSAFDKNEPLTQDVLNYFNMCFDHLKENKHGYLFDPISAKE